MKKFLSFVILMAVFALMPFVSVNAEERTVNTQDELKAAIADGTVDTIVLGGDILTTEKITISRPVTIDGANHKITYSLPLAADWTGIYVLHFYKTTGTVKDITLTGAEGAINVNGSTITLEGTIDVSGNRAGGIELGKGGGVTEFPDVITDNATIVNTTESSTAPTVWIDIPLAELGNLDGDDSATDEFDVESWPFKGAAYLTDKDQIQMFLSRDNVPTGDTVIDVSDEFTSVDGADDSNVSDDSSTIQKREEPKEDNVANENPNTYDGLIFYLLFGLISFVILGYSYTKATSR